MATICCVITRANGKKSSLKAEMSNLIDEATDISQANNNSSSDNTYALLHCCSSYSP